MDSGSPRSTAFLVRALALARLAHTAGEPARELAEMKLAIAAFESDPWLAEPAPCAEVAAHMVDPIRKKYESLDPALAAELVSVSLQMFKFRLPDSVLLNCVQLTMAIAASAKAHGSSLLPHADSVIDEMILSFK